MNQGITEHPLYETPAAYDRWLRLLLGVIALALFLPLALAQIALEELWWILAVAAFYAILLHAILPRRFLVFRDRLRVVLGRPFGFNISFGSIKEARVAPGGRMFIYWGVRFATSAASVVEIVRRRGLSIVISPADRETFLEQFNGAL